MKRWKAYRMLSCNISISVIYLLNANDIPRVLDSLVSCTHKSNNLVKSWVKSSNRKNRLVHDCVGTTKQTSSGYLASFLFVCLFVCLLIYLLFVVCLFIYLLFVRLFIVCLFVFQ